MGKAIAKAVRLQIVEAVSSGKTRRQVATELRVSYKSVCRFYADYKAGGEAALNNGYSNCGPKEVKFDQLIYRSCCWLKYLHPDWSAAYILMKIAKRYGKTYDLPGERTVQIWFEKKGYGKKKLKNEPPRSTPNKAEFVHDVWQIDAKEKVPLASGRHVCWLTVVDEYSCSVLQAPAFVLTRISGLNVATAQQAMTTLFKKWGMPRQIKFDNGSPFGDPNRKIIPLLSLWLIGLGIEVIFNRPATPTDNSKVERMQSVTKRWSNPDLCQDLEAMQSSLDESIDLQRNHFKLRRHGHKTRCELYPELNTAYNTYDADTFDLQRVYDKMAKGRWERLVSKNGQIYFYDQRFYLGRAYARQVIQVTFDSSVNQWMASDNNGKVIKHFVVTNISEEILCDLAKLSKN